MGEVIVDISMTLDGFIAGPNDSPTNPLGDNGDQIHHWVYELASWRERHGMTGGAVNADGDLLEEAFANTRAVLMGKRMFDHGEPHWGDEPPFHVPVYVVTHQVREPLERIGTTFYFVNNGIMDALAQAQTAADGHDIAIAGGANIIQQYLKAGVIDILQVHITHTLLGGGVRLFDMLADTNIQLSKERLLDSEANVTHLKFRINK